MKARVANSLIVGTVAVLTLIIATLAGVGKGIGVMPALFIGFFALIIAIQVVPALMLFGTLVREVYRRLFRGGREGRSISR